MLQPGMRQYQPMTELTDVSGAFGYGDSILVGERVRLRGVRDDVELMTWLEKYMFPLEKRFVTRRRKSSAIWGRSSTPRTSNTTTHNPQRRSNKDRASHSRRRYKGMGPTIRQISPRFRQRRSRRERILFE